MVDQKAVRKNSRGGKGIMKRKREMIKDILVEIKKPRRKDAVWGVRNASVVAYVYYLGEPRGSWETRYSVGIEIGSKSVGTGRFTNSLTEAKEWAKSSVKGRAFRAFIQRMR